MTSPPPAIGQEVEIIGPSEYGNICHVGEKFTISIEHQDSKMLGGRMLYSAKSLPWYPASSLRLVEEELKVGDWVRIDNPEFKSHGEIFQISGVLLERTGTYLSDAPNKRHFAECHLRKLTPEEVRAHLQKEQQEGAKHASKNIGEFTATLKLDTSGFVAEIDKATAKLWKLQVGQRLSAIEKRQKQIDHWIDRFAKVGARWETEKAEQERRLAFLEASQKSPENAVLGSFGPVPHCIAEMIRQVTEMAKKRRLEGEGQAGLEDRRLFVLRQIAADMKTVCTEHITIQEDRERYWLIELEKVEKQIAEGQ